MVTKKPQIKHNIQTLKGKKRKEQKKNNNK